MNEHGLTAEAFLRAFPPALQDDPELYALAQSTAADLAQHAEELRQLMFMVDVEQMPEELLDILAYDYKIDWWDQAASLSEKRDTFRSSWSVHRLLGTKAAVEMAMQTTFGGGTVREWFDYGGEPYHFRIENIPPEAIERYQSFLQLLSVVKRESAVLDSIRARAESTMTIYTGAVVRTAKKTSVPGAAVPPEKQKTIFFADQNGAILVDGDTYIVKED